MRIKICKICKQKYTVHAYRYKTAKFCSTKCYSASIIGRKLNHKAGFFKGMIPWNKGIKLPEQSGNKHFAFKGNNVGYRSLHNWIRSKLGEPDTCEHCDDGGLIGHKIHWANKSGKYKRDKKDWIRLCAKCHKAYDKKRNKK